jgi:hypothetical protein
LRPFKGVPLKDIRVNKMGDMVTVHMPIKTANKMLKTEFALFRSVTQRNIAIPRVTKPYYLPEEVAEHVQIVADIIRFPALRQGPTAFGYEEGATTDPEFNTCGTKCNGYTTVSATVDNCVGHPQLTSLHIYFSPMCSALRTTSTT